MTDAGCGRGGVGQPVAGRAGGDELGDGGREFAAQDALCVTGPGEDGAVGVGVEGVEEEGQFGAVGGAQGTDAIAG